VKRMLRISISVWFGCFAVLEAKLVPIPCITDPPIQRLSRSETKGHWGLDPFGDCHGVDMMPLPRLERGDGMPIAFVISDPGREQLKFGMCREDGEERVMDWQGFRGQVGFGGDSLFWVRGVAIDTFMYEQSSSKLYVYVASRNSRRVMKYRFDVSARSLTYLSDIYTTDTGRVDDVCCARASFDSPYGTYVAVINSFKSQLTILGVNKTTWGVTAINRDTSLFS
jgi:hypothetical protein